MKELRVTAEWRSENLVEVPDDYEWDGHSLDEEWADQITSQMAELIDWTVKD
jgi:hypothetical protein